MEKTKAELEMEKIESIVFLIITPIFIGMCYLAIRFVHWAWETSVF